LRIELSSISNRNTIDSPVRATPAARRDRGDREVSVGAPTFSAARLRRTFTAHSFDVKKWRLVRYRVCACDPASSTGVDAQQ
jgi:hypothetical protein